MKRWSCRGIWQFPCICWCCSCSKRHIGKFPGISSGGSKRPVDHAAPPALRAGQARSEWPRASFFWWTGAAVTNIGDGYVGNRWTCWRWCWWPQLVVLSSEYALGYILIWLDISKPGSYQDLQRQNKHAHWIASQNYDDEESPENGLCTAHHQRDLHHRLAEQKDGRVHDQDAEALIVRDKVGFLWPCIPTIVTIIQVSNYFVTYPEDLTFLRFVSTSMRLLIAQKKTVRKTPMPK